MGATKIEGVNGTRWTYTASGQVTIVAARLAARARGGAPDRGRNPGRMADEFPFDALGDRTLRNVEAPVEVFRLTVTQPVPAAATA